MCLSMSDEKVPNDQSIFHNFEISIRPSDHYQSRLPRESVYTVCPAANQKDKTDATVDQNLDAQNRLNNSAPFNEPLRIQVTA